MPDYTVWLYHIYMPQLFPVVSWNHPFIIQPHNINTIRRIDNHGKTHLVSSNVVTVCRVCSIIVQHNSGGRRQVPRV